MKNIVKITVLLICATQLAYGESGVFKKLGSSIKETASALTAPTLSYIGHDLRQKRANGELKKRDDGFYFPASGDYSFGFDSGNGNVGVVWECSPEKGLEKFNELTKQGIKKEKLIMKCAEGLPSGYFESSAQLANREVEYYANIYTEETYTPHSISLYMHEDKAWVELVFFNLINEKGGHPGILNRMFRGEKEAAEQQRIKAEYEAREKQQKDAEKTAEEKRIAEINEQVKNISSAKQWQGPNLYFKDTTGLRLAYSLLNEGETVSEKIGEVITLTEADPSQVWWEVFQVGNNFALIKPASRTPTYKYSAENQKLFDEGIFMIQDSPHVIGQLLEGQRVKGYYFLAGIQRYKTVLGVEKSVPCLLRVDVSE